MKKRDFLRIGDLSLAEARQVLGLARSLKAEPKGTRLQALSGRAVAIVMEKPSTRTRVSFEVGVAQLGAHPVVLTTDGSQIARGEPIKDTARVLSGYADAIVYRTFGDERLGEMARFASVPVINALSDAAHPVQVLCDVFTIEEALGRSVEGTRIAGGQVGPDLLKMDRSCPRIADPAVRQLCVLDQDDFFMKSVQDGKTRVGVVHMPAWKAVLSPAAIWTIRSFLESRSR